MALPVANGVPYKVKLGKSFSDRNNNAFHTISYDFKPMSVDYSKPARMRVSEDEVIVSVPNVQAESDDDVTQFRGGKKICQKECVLIINTKTREATLERVINSVQLKVLRTVKEKNKTAGKLMDRSISPLPNPPSGQPLKLSNKLTGPLRSQSPLQAGRPPKKKKKAVSSGEATASLQVASHDPVTQQDVSGSHLKMKSDHPKPSSSSYHTSHASFSSSLSSSESDMEEVSMPTISHGNSTIVTTADGNGMLRELVKREKSGHDSSSSASDTSSSDSQSDDDSDEVVNAKHLSPRRPSMSVLHNDLHLSDPSSESDSE